MVRQDVVALAFLVYVFLPIMAYLIYWVVKRLRRGGADGEASEEP